MGSDTVGSCHTPTSSGVSLRPAVFLDRDGVLNRAIVREGKPYPPVTEAELEILPGVADALHGLRAAGFCLIVVTNQPDVARGTQTRAGVERINAALQSALPIDEFCVCYHTDKDQCTCRKPLPGLLKAAAQRHGIDLSCSYMVGDRWRDIDAGHNAGCTTLFIDYDYAETLHSRPDVTVKSLAEAGDWILNNSPQERK